MAVVLKDVGIVGDPAAPSEESSNDPERTRVLIVEDHQVVAEGLTALINQQEDMEVVGSVGTLAQSERAAIELRPDIVLLDYRLPDGTAPDAASAIRRARPE